MQAIEEEKYIFTWPIKANTIDRKIQKLPADRILGQTPKNTPL